MASSPARVRPTLSNDEQLWLMQQVKLNVMTIDEAVTWTASRENELKMEYELRTNNTKDRINVSTHKNQFKATKVLKTLLNKKTTKKSESEKVSLNSNEDTQDGLTAFAHDLRNKKIYNFSVYKCAKAKSPQKRILQVDFDGKLLSLIHRGNITKAHPFSSIVSVDGQEGKKVFLFFDEAQELEINAENLADKTKLIRLLNIICEQNDHEERGEPFDPCEKLQLSFRVIKEGYLEKKGGYTALNWNKRLVVIRAGELAYYRIDEEEQSAALNIIHLSPGSIAINAEDSNTFTIATTKESHRFRLPENGPSLACSQEKIRDEWIEALHDGCKRHYQKTSSSEEEEENEQEKEQESSEVADVRDSFDVILEEMQKLKSTYTEQENNNSLSSEMKEKIMAVEKLLSELKKSSKTREASNKSRKSIGPISTPVTAETPPMTSPPNGVITASQDKDDQTRVRSLVESLIINTEEIALKTEKETHQYTTISKVRSSEKHADSNGTLTSLNDDVFADENPYSLADETVKFSALPPPPSFLADSAISEIPSNLSSGNSEIPATASSEISAATTPDMVKSGNQVPPLPPPPPPPLGVPPPPGVPVPPPLGGIPAPPSVAVLDTAEPKIQMRPFHWQPVSKQLIGKSIWKNIDDFSSQIDQQELIEMFQITNDKKGHNSTSSTPMRVQVLPSSSETPKRRALESYLDHKTAQNLGIFMAGFKLRGEELVQKLAIINENDGGISTEQVAGLKKFCPEPELKTLYAKHEGREEELSKVDRFMSELCHIPRLSTRLEVLTTIRELPQELEALGPEVELSLRACHELLDSKLFEILLSYILSVGNLINASNSKGTTKGIRLSTLQKTCIMRTNDRKRTLLQVVLRIVKHNTPQVLDLQQEMTSLSKTQSHSAKGLLAEIDIMRKSVIKVRKSCELLKKKKYHPTKEDLQFCSDAEASLGAMENSITQLSEKCMEIKRTVTKVLVKFGESPDSDSQEIFTSVREFLDHFKKSLPP